MLRIYFYLSRLCLSPPTWNFECYLTTSSNNLKLMISALRKFLRAGKSTQLMILEKDAVDESIFRTSNQSLYQRILTIAKPSFANPKAAKRPEIW
jgi:hypothetical protein